MTDDNGVKPYGEWQCISDATVCNGLDHPSVGTVH